MEESEKKERKRKKFKETKVGAFLIEKFPDIAEKALVIADEFNLPGAGVLKTLFSNQPGVSNEDRTAFSQAIADYELEAARINVELEKVFAGDRDSARKREVEIAKTDSGWLIKNIVPLLALVWTAFTITLFVLVLVGQINAKENITFLVINSVTNIIMLIVGYYFGSSAGSSAKQNQINQMINKE